MTFGKIKQNILVLSFSNLIIGLIEFVFNMYLSRLFGAEGLGLLSLITPINCIFLSFMTEGVVITISKMSAQYQENRNFAGMDITVKVATLASFLWSLILVVVVRFTAGMIAGSFLGDHTLAAPILATCPLMLLMSVSNILKGHFLGLAKIRIPALINIGEKLMRFPILYLLIKFFLNNTSFPPITLVFICYAIGEVQSVLLLLIYYIKKRPAKSPFIFNRNIFTSVLKPLIRGAVPICLTECLLEFVNAFSSIIVKARLCSCGFSTSEALALLGKYKGMVFPLLNYPMILVGASCAIVVPRIATFLTAGRQLPAKRLIIRVLSLSLLTGLITCLIFMFSAGRMGMFFYKRDDLALMIRLAGLCAPLLYITAASTNILISAGYESLSFRNTLFQQILLLTGLMIFTGIPELNIYGYLLSIALSQAVLLCKNLSFIFKKLN